MKPRAQDAALQGGGSHRVHAGFVQRWIIWTQGFHKQTLFRVRLVA